MKKYYYYYDRRGAALVRHRGYTYMMTADEPVWIKLPPDDSYEREICLGQGNNCLDPLTPDEVLEILNEWHFTVRDESQL